MGKHDNYNTSTIPFDEIARALAKENGTSEELDDQQLREKATDLEIKTYRHIAGALASRYEVIYYIDIDNNSYTRYSSSDDYARLGTSTHGDNFFTDAVEDAKKYIHPDDTERLCYELKKDRLLKNLEESGSFTITYRQLLADRSQYVSMIIVRPKYDDNHIVIAVLNKDAQVRREHSMLQESETFAEISTALSARYEVIYQVNIETNEYVEYSSSDKYSKLKVGAKGADFFGDTQRNMPRDIYSDDLHMMQEFMKKETLLKHLRETRKTFMNYRLMLDGRPQYVTLFAVLPKKDSDHIIVAVENIDDVIRKEKEFERAIGTAMDMANKDALTGIKNKHAYVNAEIEIDEQILKGTQEEFSIAVCDINGLKQVNDEYGHSAGDDYIKSACSLICNTFKHSPVFRIGGDEFVVILKGKDYENRAPLVAEFEMMQADNRRHNLVTLAYGISDYEPGKDLRMQDVFERADNFMYVNKKYLKGDIPNPAEEKPLLDENLVRFYKLYEQLVSAMTTIGKTDRVLIEGILVEICKMFRLSKGVVRLYKNPREEQTGQGETMVCFDNGSEGKEIISLRVVTSVMSIATITVFMSPDEKPLSEEEHWKVELVMRTTLSFVSRNRLKDIVEELAFFDEEKYPNIRSFSNYIGRMSAKGLLSGMAVYHYNLRHFSLINQEFGRPAGDKVMRAHYDKLKEILGIDEALIRLGGDNFIGSCTMEHLEAVLKYLTETILPIDEEHTVTIGCSVGVFCIPKDYPVHQPSDILGQIISAQQIAKTGARGNIVYFDESLMLAKEKSKRVQQMFPEALANGEFKPYYQPKVNITTGKLEGAEALCRWFHNGKMIPPGDFIPMLEEGSDICRLDLHMLDCVCRNLRRWLDEGKEIVRISVNFSRKNIINAGLVSAITEIVDHYQIPHEYIEVELTETTTDVAFNDLKRIVGGLHMLGFHTAIDDFGVGFSSLNLLREIPWSVLKIDRSILPVEEDEENSSRRIMFKHVVSIARQLGLECIAEGVETKQQVEILRENNCDLAQGFFFDKPLPVEYFEERLIRGNYEE